MGRAGIPDGGDVQRADSCGAAGFARGGRFVAGEGGGAAKGDCDSRRDGRRQNAHPQAVDDREPGAGVCRRIAHRLDLGQKYVMLKRVFGGYRLCWSVGDDFTFVDTTGQLAKTHAIAAEVAFECMRQSKPWLTMVDRLTLTRGWGLAVL